MTSMSTTSVDSRVSKPRSFVAPVRIIGLSLFVGWLFEWAFFAKPLGIGGALFVLGLFASTALAGRFESVKLSLKNGLLIVPTLFFAAMLAVRANEFLTFLNVMVILLLLMLWAHYFSAESPLTQTISGYVAYPAIVMAHAVFSGLSVLLEAGQDAKERGRGGTALPLIRGLLLALPVLIVFVGLLGAADAIFAQQIKSVINLDSFDTLMQRLLLILFIAWLSTGAMAYALTREQKLISAEQREKVGDTPAPAVNLQILGHTEATVVLTLVNLLFATFVSLQFVYLFGGATNITIDGYTYAEYARNGFFELVAVAVLSLSMILLLQTVTKRETGKQTTLFNTLCSIMIVFVTVMLVSAHQRLSLYELSYGYTSLRLQSHTFILWLAVALAWVMVMLWFRPKQIAFGLFVCGLAFVAHLNIMNPDALIVKHNFSRYEQLKALVGKEVAEAAAASDMYRVNGIDSSLSLDALYWTTLSADATPTILTYLDEVPPISAEILRDHLEYDFDSMQYQFADTTWQSYHVSRAQALSALTTHFGTDVSD